MSKPAILAGAMKLPIGLIDIKSVQSAMTIKYQPMGAETPSLLKNYKIDSDYLYVPRQYGIGLCRRNGLEFDDQTSPGVPVVFPKIPKPREYQLDALKSISNSMSEYYDFIFRARTGFGKCQAKGTPILMYDGTVKKVEDVIVGDKLMGPDSNPRTVSSLARGREEMFEVRPTKGEAHTFNKSHILSLKATASMGSVVKGEVVNVEISDYLLWSKKRKHLFKLWRTGVEFQQSFHLPYDPYFVGLYLGDGLKDTYIKLHIGDTRSEVKAYLRQYIPTLGVEYKETPQAGCTEFGISLKNHDFRDFVQLDLQQSGERHIPHEYLTASRQNRLALLAGIIDTDGFMVGKCYDIVAKDKGFIHQIAFLARSLGFAAYTYVSHKKAQGWSETRPYHRVTISGNTDEIPVLTSYRKAEARLQKKNVLVTGFEIASVGEGDYFGFTLDGDHLYLLGDFTVTHNTFCGIYTAAKLGVSTLILVDQENLKDQWIETLVNLFGFKLEDVGIIQGKVCNYAGKAVTIAMVQTLSQKAMPQEVYDYFGFLIVDEVHIIGAPTFSTILMQFSASYRLGMSATPKRRDGLQKVLDYSLGRVKVYVEDEHEASSVYVTEHPTVYSWYANASPKVGRFINEIADDASRNLMLAESTAHLYDTGRNVLVLSDRIEHLKNLKSLCYYLGIPNEDMGLYAGYDPTYAYEKNPTPMRKPVGYQRGVEYTPISLQLISKRIKKSRLKEVKTQAKVIFSTYGMFSKGVDEPRLSAGVDATPRSRSEQVQGRILRPLAGKLKPIWITTVDTNSYRSMYAFAGRLPEYAKNNSVISKWSLHGETEKCDPTEIKKKTLIEIARLKSLQVVVTKDGLNTLMTQADQMNSEILRVRGIKRASR